MTEERERLFSATNEDLRVAADGGESVEDILGELQGKIGQNLSRCSSELSL